MAQSHWSLRLNSGKRAAKRLLRGKPLVQLPGRDSSDRIWSYYPAIGAVVVATIILGSVIVVPAFQGWLWESFFQGNERPMFVNEARRTVLQFWGGVVVLLGLYFAWRRILATDEANRIERGRHATERFSTAVEQLGHADAAVRAGAIYTLERFATETALMAWTVAEILNRFIRDRCSSYKPYQHDVQAALTVLGRRPWREKEDAHNRIDFRNLLLTGYDLSRCDFGRSLSTSAAFDGSVLEFTSFYDSDLRRASFKNVRSLSLNMSHANASFSDWTGAWLPFMHAESAQLKHAKMLNVRAQRGQWSLARLERLTSQEHSW